MSALEAAYDDLRRRVRAADRAGDWQERSILDPLASVADYVKRIGDHGASAHYRADKAGDLVWWALRLEREALVAYARDERGDNATEDALERAAEVRARAAQTATKALWLVARTGPRRLPLEALERAATSLSVAVDAAWDEIYGDDEGHAL